MGNLNARGRKKYLCCFAINSVVPTPPTPVSSFLRANSSDFTASTPSSERTRAATNYLEYREVIERNLCECH